jgi:hypothetical protein
LAWAWRSKSVTPAAGFAGAGAERATGNKGSTGATTRAAPRRDTKLRREEKPASVRVKRSLNLSNVDVDTRFPYQAAQTASDFDLRYDWIVA